ncbi:MAG: hypothetical protein M3178_09715 [Pseudomonadota bacterium]|nr:hypothetical protein [Pseudomonadota bacterium]
MVRRIWFTGLLLSIFVIAVLCCFSFPAFAAQPQPGDACNPAQVTHQFQWNNGPNATGYTDAMFCESNTWVGVMTLQSTGNVGTGTTQSRAVEIFYTSNWGIVKLIGNGTNVESSIGLRSSNVADTAAGSWIIGTNTNALANGAFGIYSASPAGNAITILTNGNVGIGTMTLRTSLDVNGGLTIEPSDLDARHQRHHGIDLRRHQLVADFTIRQLKADPANVVKHSGKSRRGLLLPFFPYFSRRIKHHKECADQFRPFSQ